MSDDLAGVGDIATGALIARAIDPPAGGGQGDTLCLNCGTALIGSHCHRCGQAGHIHRTIGAIWHEILHGVVHFEGKLWRTLPLLAWRPGELTRRYIDGERARFVSPMAMFLFSIFTMFAVLQIMGISAPAQIGSQTQMVIQLDRTIEELRADRVEETEKLRTMPEDDPARPQQAELVRDLSSQEAALKAALPIVDGNGGLNSVKTGWARLDKGIAKAEENPSLMLYKLQTNSYKFSWLLIPLSIPFLWMMFAWKRGIRCYDHAVFVTYSIAFMSLLSIALLIGTAIGLAEEVIATVATFVPILHMYRQLRGTYRLRRFSAMWRLAVLLVFISIIISFFVVMLVGLGLVG